MITRRQTAIGLASAALGSAAVTSASVLSNTAAASADLRVVIASELRLVPARPNEEYVQTDDAGAVEAIVIEKLNQRSVSRFDGLVEITNEGDVTYDWLAFAFRPAGDDPDESDAAVAETLSVVSAEGDADTDEEGRTTLLADTNEALAPGDSTTFGVAVNLIPDDDPGDLDDLPGGSTISLEITAVRE
ncbi:hypothetical protein [Halorubrum trueperi]|uniref:Uncharacterized protein n=1 Tax=Halorubrum trueperi TaxID=2004704 RepID=A0ABD5UKJ4_9EURY